MTPQAANVGPGVPDATGQHRTLSEAIELLVEASHRAETPNAFLRSALAVLASTFNARAAALEMRLMSHVISESYLPQPEHAPFWEDVIQRALTDAASEGCGRARTYRRRSGRGTLALVAAPVRASNGHGSGSLALACDCTDRHMAAEMLDQLSSLASLIGLLLGSLDVGTEHTAVVSKDELSTLRKASHYATTTELAYAITNKLRSRDGCEMVALARVHGTRVQLLSISGLDEIRKKSPGVRTLQAAMEECRDFGRPVVLQEESISSEACVTGGRLHGRWRAESEGAAVASLPLRDGDEIVAILSVRRSPHMHFAPADLEEFQTLVEPYAGTLGFIERASRSLLQHVRAACGTTLHELFSGRGYGKKLSFVTPLVLAFWLAFGTLDYSVTVPATITPSGARQIGTPLDGVLSAVHCAPGQAVQEGAILCVFDVSELELEARRLASELEILGIQENQALADNVAVDIQLTHANLAQVRANLALVEHRIEAAHVRAPVSGTVIRGDLRERVGDVFGKGEALFEIATVDGWTLELAVPERAISDVQIGMVGRFSSMARAEESHEIVIDRIDPGAVDHEGDNVFVARAEIAIDEDWIRSGMEGIAHVEIGERNAWWTLFHRATDWLHLRLWL